jgi:hypothetical protein
MKRLCLRCFLCLVILVSIFIKLAVISVYAQAGPVDFDRFEPSAGSPDTELELTLFGSGFDVIQNMEIIIDDMGVSDWQIESNDAIRVGIYIPPDTPPGPKRVEINYLADDAPFQAVIEDGFEVLVAGSVQLFSVDPPDGSPGTEMDIFLRGEGFAPAEDYDVGVEGVEVLGRDIESNEVMHARIFIPEDAPPGPRRVEVVVQRDGQPIFAALEDGFLVRESEQLPGTPTSSASAGSQQPPTPPPPNPPLPWIWFLITVLLSGASFAVGRMLTIRSRLSWKQKAKLQWQVQAQTRLPQPKKACEWACKASVSADLLNRWKVTRIELTPLSVRGRTPPKKYIGGSALDPLNELMSISDALLPQEEKRGRLTPVVNGLMTQVMAWEQEGQSPASIRLDAKLAGTINSEFGLYHCHQTKKGLSWGKKPLLKWKHKLNQPGGEFLGVLRGPAAGELDFAARARNELEECLLDLVSPARFRL